MRNEDRTAVSAPCGFSKECVTRVTRRSFDRHFLFCGEGAYVCRTELKMEIRPWCRRASASLADPGTRQAGRLPYKLLIAALDQPLDKPRFGIARSPAQSMIQMANDQSFVTEANSPVQQRDRIAPAGHTDQIASIRGEVVCYSRIDLHVLHEVSSVILSAAKLQRSGRRPPGQAFHL